MLLSNRTKGKKSGILVYLILIFLILPLAYFFLIQPQQWQIEMLLREYETQEHNVRLLEQFGRDHPDIDQQVSLLDQKIRGLSSILPNDPDLENLLIWIEDNAEKYQLQLLALAAGKAVDKTSYQENKIEILVRGEYFAVMNFIKNLEDGPRFISMQAISLTERAGLMDVKLEISVFSQKEKKP